MNCNTQLTLICNHSWAGIAFLTLINATLRKTNNTLIANQCKREYCLNYDIFDLKILGLSKNNYFPAVVCVSTDNSKRRLQFIVCGDTDNGKNLILKSLNHINLSSDNFNAPKTKPQPQINQ